MKDKKIIFTFTNASFVCYWILQPRRSLSINQEHLNRESENFELFIFDYLFQYGGTNFTAFRMIDTNKFEVKTVIKDIVSREMTLGHPLNIEVSLKFFFYIKFLKCLYYFRIQNLWKFWGIWQLFFWNREDYKIPIWKKILPSAIFHQNAYGGFYIVVLP